MEMMVKVGSNSPVITDYRQLLSGTCYLRTLANGSYLELKFA